MPRQYSPKLFKMHLTALDALYDYATKGRDPLKMYWNGYGVNQGAFTKLLRRGLIVADDSETIVIRNGKPVAVPKVFYRITAAGLKHVERRRAKESEITNHADV